MKKILLILGLLLVSSQANAAATCFWVGGTGSWTASNTASWSSSSGGGAGTCAATNGIPGSSGQADTATLDGASGGGTVTVGAGFNPSLASITMSAFTGTLDFSANNNNATFSSSFNSNGAGTRTINCGTGTWTFTSTANGIWFTNGSTNMTENCTGVNISVVPSGNLTAAVFMSNINNESLGPLSVNFSGSTTNWPFQPNSSVNTTVTFASCSFTGVPSLILASNKTTACTGASSFVGTLSRPMFIGQINATPAILTTTVGSTFNWVDFLYTNVTNGGTANNSLNFGGATSTGGTLTINAPSTGGFVGIIGGGI